MDPLFTRFVRLLERTAGEELFVEVWERLRTLLGNELKRRGLWTTSPSYLGVYGWSYWEAPGPAAGGALEELVADLYAFIFVERLGSLTSQLAMKPNIEGLVLLNLRHFLLERQQQQDPLGFRVFEMVRGAALASLAAGEIHLLDGNPRVRNDTLLGFAPGRREATPEARLAALVAGWNDGLLPGLLTAQGGGLTEVIAELRRLLGGLAGQGVAAFRFRDVVDPLKSDARQRWAALLEDEDGLRSELAPADSKAEPASWAEAPGISLEARQNLERLIAGVSQAIRQADVDEGTRGYLATVWLFLQAQSGAMEEMGRDPALPFDLSDQRRLSQRKLAQLLGIPRARLPEVLATLKRFVTEARAGDPSANPRAPRGREGCPARLSGRRPAHATAWDGRP